ncbi:MAG: hypothetical protein KDK28_07955 [Maritimibacter sp.]|nr:hypothetical protein [Maritimibacter sp.]
MVNAITINLSEFDWEAVSALSGVLIAILGFAISLTLWRREKVTERYVLLAEYRKELMAFSQTFFELVSDALAVRSRATGDAEVELDRIASRLSGLVDTGRFLFPNDIEGENAIGAKKGPAFEGRRRPPLDAILAAHHAAMALKYEGEARKPSLVQALKALKKTGQPLTEPVRATDPVYLLIQSRRCYLNAVVPDTFPRKWRRMFTTLLGPSESRADAGSNPG